MPDVAYGTLWESQASPAFAGAFRLVKAAASDYKPESASEGPAQKTETRSRDRLPTSGATPGTRAESQ